MRCPILVFIIFFAGSVYATKQEKYPLFRELACRQIFRDVDERSYEALKSDSLQQMIRDMGRDASECSKPVDTATCAYKFLQEYYTSRSSDAYDMDHYEVFRLLVWDAKLGIKEHNSQALKIARLFCEKQRDWEECNEVKRIPSFDPFSKYLIGSFEFAEKNLVPLYRKNFEQMSKSCMRGPDRNDQSEKDAFIPSIPPRHQWGQESFACMSKQTDKYIHACVRQVPFKKTGTKQQERSEIVR